MKRNTTAALIFVVVLISTAGIIWNRSAQAMSIRVNVRDVREHGLRIIGPMDPAFNGMLSAHLRRRTNVSVETLTPFSFFVKNNANQDVVGIMVRWELTGPDGVLTTKEMGYTNIMMLTNGESLDEPSLSEEMRTGNREEQRTRNRRDVIRPNSAWFFAIGFPPESAEDDDTGDDVSTGAASGSASQTNQAEIQRAIEERNQPAMLRVLRDQLAQSTDITISITGAFFADGTFVGSDSNGLFANIKAHVDANRDLLQEIALGVRRQMPPEEIFNHIRSLTDRPNSRLGRKATPAERYNFYKRMYAEALLRRREVIGDDRRTISAALRPLRRPWPRLRRMVSHSSETGVGEQQNNR